MAGLTTAGVEFSGSVMRYAEIEQAESRFRLQRLGNCEFEFDAASVAYLGMQPDLLYIDTGIVTGDYSVTPLAVTVPTGYNYQSIETLIGVGNTVTGITYSDGELTAIDNIAPGFRSIIKFERSKL